MPTARAVKDGVVLAEANAWETVEGNVYVREDLGPQGNYP